MFRCSELLIAAMVVLVAGCSAARYSEEQPVPVTSMSTTSATAYPTSQEQACAAQSWPRPLPQVAGLSFDDLYAGALGCWNDVRGLAPDGHDVTLVKGPSGVWKISGIRPPPGTMLGRDDTVTVTLIPDDDMKPVIWPCDWVSVAEAKAILGVSSIETLPIGDTAGSVTPTCDYQGPGNQLITSELMLPGSFAIDPESELDLMKSGGGEPVFGLRGSEAHCAKSQLLVLLSGGRAYQVMGWGAQSCEQLKAFAQAALGRIPA